MKSTSALREFIPPSVFNMESIAARTESASITALEDTVQFLKEEFLSLKLQTNKDIVNIKEYKDKMQSLEDVLFNEYGIHFKFYGTDAGPHCIVPPGPASNIINHTSKELSIYLKKIMRNYKIRPENKQGDIKELRTNQDMINLISTLGKSMNEIEKSYFDRRVKVDFKKGKITGLNKDVVVLMGIPFIHMFKMNFTNREIIAVILHEIGHGFNSIAYMHQYFTTVNTTIEGLYEAKSEKEIVDSYNNIIAMDGRKVDNIKGLFYDIFKNSDKTNGNPYAIKNNESMADQFAVRHGYGKDLVEALARITGNLESAYISKAFSVVIGFGKTVALIVGLLVMSPLYISLAIVFAVPVVLLILMIKVIEIVITSSIPKDEIGEYILDTKDIYDDLEQRFKRIKFDLVRQIKGSEIKNKKDLLDQVKVIENLIKNVEEDRTTWTNLKYLITLSRRDVGISDFYMAAEEMVENDLHVRSETFKRIFK